MHNGTFSVLALAWTAPFLRYLLSVIMAYTMNRSAMGEVVGTSAATGPRHVRPLPARRSRAAARVSAVAAPQRGDVSQIQRPDASGRFGQYVSPHQS